MDRNPLTFKEMVDPYKLINNSKLRQPYLDIYF